MGNNPCQLRTDGNAQHNYKLCVTSSFASVAEWGAIISWATSSASRAALWVLRSPFWHVACSRLTCVVLLLL